MTDRPSVEATLLRPALEWAVVVARREASETPGRPVPPGLRPYVRFQKLPAAAMRAARSAIEDDDEFRTRVAEAAGAEEVGPAGWLWLTRPEGWEADFEGEVQAATAAAEVAGEQASSQSAERRLAGAEEAARRWESRAGEAESALARARVEREALLVERDELAARLVAAESEAARLAEERARAVRELKDTEARLARRDAELRAARSESGSRAPEPVVEAPAGVDPRELARGLDDARAALAATETALIRLGELAPADPRPRAGDGEASVRRRRAVRVGAGLHDDSEAAARWLLELDGVTVLVDGYNVTMSAWPDLAVADQRRALDRSLVALAARTGAAFVVVYDGDGSSVARPRERGLDVRFTDAGVEADDEIIRLAGELPADRPVVVVSDDRRVRDGARAEGANLVGSRQIRGLLVS